MNEHPEVEHEEAMIAVGADEDDIVSYVRSQQGEFGRRGSDLRYGGRLGQLPVTTQSSAAEPEGSSRPRSSGRRRSLGSSSAGAESSIPSPTPYQLSLEQKILKQNKVIQKQQGKISNQNNILKKMLGFLTCMAKNTGTATEEVESMTAQLENLEDEAEDEDEAEAEDEAEDIDQDEAEAEGEDVSASHCMDQLYLQPHDTYMAGGASFAEHAAESIFGPSLPRQTGVFIRTPGEHPPGTQPGPTSVAEETPTSKDRKDKGKAKMVPQRRSTRRM